jgi:hypothetical protein
MVQQSPTKPNGRLRVLFDGWRLKFLWILKIGRLELICPEIPDARPLSSANPFGIRISSSMFMSPHPATPRWTKAVQPINYSRSMTQDSGFQRSSKQNVLNKPGQMLRRLPVLSHHYDQFA